jgi:hypothetical protein
VSTAEGKLESMQINARCVTPSFDSSMHSPIMNRTLTQHSKFRRLTRIAGLGLIIACFTPSLRAQGTSAVTFTDSTPDLFSVSQHVIGFDFAVSTPLTVTALGFYDLGGDGLAVSHAVGIWGPDAPVIVEPPLAQTTVTAAGFLQDSFRYQSISPLLLSPGITYTIGAFTQTNAQSGAGMVDLYFSQLTAGQVVVAPGVLLGDAKTSTIDQPGLTRPAVNFSGANLGFFGPGFLVQPIPEPGISTLFAIGLIGGGYLTRSRRRRRP